MNEEPNLPEPTFEDKPSSVKSTVQLIASVFHLTKKVLML